MTQKTLDGKDVEEPSIWSDGAFAETLGQDDMKVKMRTFHMKHDEEMNYNCSKCKAKISAHNNDWHNRMCDKCFNKEFFPED
ncbi:MAG: hypothetical protein QS98_C0004G0069 [archaeon GW2011_AR3]|nr:MAG: hypothetical protein QS98_C0004G0069 [archaeon GW2011_AR3]MBS3109622.1 hypothetical protein [Candidatus Woesearchaeota archaeon]